MAVRQCQNKTKDVDEAYHVVFIQRRHEDGAIIAD
jgi:hypothetical protein